MRSGLRLSKGPGSLAGVPAPPPPPVDYGLEVTAIAPSTRSNDSEAPGYRITKGGASGYDDNASSVALPGAFELWAHPSRSNPTSDFFAYFGISESASSRSYVASVPTLIQFTNGLVYFVEGGALTHNSGAMGSLYWGIVRGADDSVRMMTNTTPTSAGATTVHTGFSRTGTFYLALSIFGTGHSLPMRIVGPAA